jgi:hypothetical protein
MSDVKIENDEILKSLENTHILIVEDSPTQALFLKAQLEEYRLAVQVAKDGVEGLQQLETSLPQLIISDIEMPRMNGYEFCKKVKTHPTYREIPVILLTSLKNPLDVIQGIQCGCNSFLTKPYSLPILLSTIWDSKENAKLHQRIAAQKKLEFFFNGQHYQMQIDQEQITGLLLSTYANAIEKNLELEQAYKKLNQVNEELQKKNEELKQLNQLKNQFLGIAAHDLRNPLTVISGYSDILLEMLKEMVPAKAMQMLQRIKTSSTLMLDLINNLLDISIIESDTVSLRLSSVDLPALIEENLDMLKSLAAKKNIQLIFNRPLSIPKVTCDPSKFIQVLNNLVGNSIKFSKPESKIEVNLFPAEKEVILSVKDEGIGLSAEVKKRLFQPFSKTGVVGTAGEKGTGLGLAIVHKIVTEHKGRIWVESEENQGATFYVALPYEPSTH